MLVCSRLKNKILFVFSSCRDCLGTKMILTTIGTCIWSTDGGSMMASSSNSKDATISKTWKNVWCATKIKTQLQIHALALVGLSFHLVIESISILNMWALLFQQGKQLLIPNTLIGLLYFLLLASNETRNGSSAPSWTQIQLPILSSSNDHERNFANPGPNNDRIDKIFIQMNCNCNKAPQSFQRRYGNLIW